MVGYTKQSKGDRIEPMILKFCEKLCLRQNLTKVIAEGNITTPGKGKTCGLNSAHIALWWDPLLQDRELITKSFVDKLKF